MRSSSKETIEHHKCPPHVERELRLAGGENPFSDPMFRVVWGYDRVVPITGEWQDWEPMRATLLDKKTGVIGTRDFVRLKQSVIETRQVPKYLPGNCWHLEMWRPAEEYGSPDDWRKQGEEVVDGLTLDTSGPYPERGEYELCYPLTSDATSHGTPIPLYMTIVAEIVRHIRHDREQRVPFLLRKAAIEQRERLREEGLLRRTMDILKDGMRPFAGETFVTVPESSVSPSKEDA